MIISIYLLKNLFSYQGMHFLNLKILFNKNIIQDTKHLKGQRTSPPDLSKLPLVVSYYFPVSMSINSKKLMKPNGIKGARSSH